MCYPISKVEYEKRSKDKACYECGSKEHWASGCRQRRRGKGKVAELEAKIAELTAKVDGKGEGGSGSRADESKNGGTRD